MDAPDYTLPASDGENAEEVLVDVSTAAGPFRFLLIHHPHDEVQIIVEHEDETLYDDSISPGVLNPFDPARERAAARADHPEARLPEHPQP